MKQLTENYKLNDLLWLFSKTNGSTEPFYYDSETQKPISALNGNPINGLEKLEETHQNENDKILILPAYDAVKKYATKKPNLYSFNLKFFIDDGFGNSFDDYVNNHIVSKKELVKLNNTIQKVYQDEYKKYKLFDLKWLINENEQIAIPFNISQNDGKAISVLDGKVLFEEESNHNKTQLPKQVIIMDTNEILHKYAMSSINRYSIEEKFLEDGLTSDDRLVTAEHLKKLTTLIQKNMAESSKDLEHNV